MKLASVMLVNIELVLWGTASDQKTSQLSSNNAFWQNVRGKWINNSCPGVEDVYMYVLYSYFTDQSDTHKCFSLILV